MTEFVKKAQEMARVLVAREAIAGRELGQAMQVAARKHNIPFGALWALRYRPPKDIFASVYFAIANAHEAICEQQRQKLEHELAVAKAAGVDADRLRQIAALGGVEAE